MDYEFLKNQTAIKRILNSNNMELIPHFLDVCHKVKDSGADLERSDPCSARRGLLSLGKLPSLRAIHRLQNEGMESQTTAGFHTECSFRSVDLVT